ncbi:MAG: hypothetical protein CFH41_00806 [Alphaproteobacteria bacterium MarineAlpha11_Bin1]|nr:MAG: hypothetical protein CFH41_00806 [Alphaproteobacteria bacterium MarineAlpha11_Bin1]
MRPTIRDGDYVVATKYKTRPVNGSVAVIQHPILGRLIKRIRSIPGTETFSASGDDDLSIESPSIGTLKEHEIEYQAKWRISPAGISRLRISDTPAP